MTLPQEFRTSLVALLAFPLACTPAHALVTLNDSRDRVFVTGTLSVSQDSNVFANSDNRGDVVVGTGFVAEYTRRAGWIGVNGSVAVTGSNFGKHKDQNFSNPAYSLEFTKQSGRTTGSLTFNGARESRADAAVNMRSSSWNYNTGLNVKYPAGINTFTGQFGYSSRKYVDSTIFANLATYSAAVDVIHILPAERELVGGYRFRFSETSRNTSSTDHSLTVGISGKLIRGIVGTIRGGWQVRVPHGGLLNQGAFSSWTLSGTASYAVSKRLNFAFGAAKDFSTTATDTSVDSTSGNVDMSYAMNSKISFSLAGGWGTTQFLGESGRVVISEGPPVLLGGQRRDTYTNWSAGVNYNFREHLKLGATYSWFENWSSNAVADFVRTSWGFNLSSRW